MSEKAQTDFLERRAVRDSDSFQSSSTFNPGNRWVKIALEVLTATAANVHTGYAKAKLPPDSRR